MGDVSGKYEFCGVNNVAWTEFFFYFFLFFFYFLFFIYLFIFFILYFIYLFIFFYFKYCRLCYLTEECEYFRISIYFSFVENVSVKYELCAVNNVPYTATFLLIKH